MIRRDLFKALLAGGMFSLISTSKATGSGTRTIFGSSGRIDKRLKDLGITLPEVGAPVATYVPFRKVGNLVYTAGQGPAAAAGMKFHGRLGQDLTIEEGYLCARQVGLNLLAVLKQACGGDLDRVVQCVSLDGFVMSADDFTDQPKVINGASDLLLEVFGDAGRHARAAIGTNTLPFNLAVEIKAVFEIRA